LWQINRFRAYVRWLLRSGAPKKEHFTEAASDMGLGRAVEALPVIRKIVRETAARIWSVMLHRLRSPGRTGQHESVPIGEHDEH
jgi:hypothetical protein